MPRKKTALGKPPSQRPDRGLPTFIPRRRRGADDPYSIAVHEAGHAVAALLLGLPLRSVDVRMRALPDGRISAGYTNCPIPATREPGVLSSAMIQLMCGPLAEDRVNPAAGRFGCHGLDLESVRRLAAIAVCESTIGPDGRESISSEEIRGKTARIREVVERAVARADELVSTHWAAIRETSCSRGSSSAPSRRVDRRRALGRPGCGRSCGADVVRFSTPRGLTSRPSRPGHGVGSRGRPLRCMAAGER